MQLNRVVAFLATAKRDESIAFFGDALGFRYVGEDDFALVFDAFGTMLRVVKAATVTPSPGTVLGWRVDDIDEAVALLTERGVVFERYSYFQHAENGVLTFASGDRVAWFKDPDGNVLSLSEHQHEPGVI